MYISKIISAQSRLREDFDCGLSFNETKIVVEQKRRSVGFEVGRANRID